MTALQRLALWLLALALVLAPGVAVFNGWIASERWPLKRLWVEAEFRAVGEQEVREAVRPHLGPGFFAVRPGDVRQALLALPWVERAEVRKRWPDVLEVRLVERRAFARFGADRLLSRRGELFAPADFAAYGHLPRLDGPEAQLTELVAFYLEAGERLAPGGVKVRGVRLSARGSWTLHLDDGSEMLLGRQQPRERLARYARLLPQLRREARAIVRADLRYADGFALQWAKPESPPPNSGSTI